MELPYRLFGLGDTNAARIFFSVSMNEEKLAWIPLQGSGETTDETWSSVRTIDAGIGPLPIEVERCEPLEEPIDRESEQAVGGTVGHQSVPNAIHFHPVMRT